ncbi:MAG: hypothetical protein QXS42_01765 [Zestosphaera sp.]
MTYDPLPQAKIPITKAQLNYEFQHLLSKLAVRNKKWMSSIKGVEEVEPHPLFYVVSGTV